MASASSGLAETALSAAPVRSYSICAVTDSGRYPIAVKREGLVNPVVLISGGIGVTPVLAMLHALAAGQSRRAVW